MSVRVEITGIDRHRGVLRLGADGRELPATPEQLAAAAEIWSRNRPCVAVLCDEERMIIRVVQALLV